MIEIPIRTGSGLNAREGHWRVRAARVRREREAVSWALRMEPKPALPCVVLLTRIAPSSGLDDDNLCGSLKGVRDEIAEWLGIDDRKRDIVRYEYAQARGVWGVGVSFSAPVDQHNAGEC